MSVSEENLEEWDDSFLEELIQVEELALSSSAVTQNNPPSSSYLPPLPPQPPPPPSHHQPLHFPPPSRADSLSYSPPRELSQRTADFSDAFSSTGVVAAKLATPSTPVRRVRGSDNAKDLEIERLKKELGRVSKLLANREHECSELKKKRDKNNQHTLDDSKNEVKVANVHGSRIANLEHGTSVAAHHGVMQEVPNAQAFDDQNCLHAAKSSSKAIGVQTDLNARSNLSRKLQAVWGLPSDQEFGRNLVSRLFAVCATDIDILRGFISTSTPSRTTEPLAAKCSIDIASQSSMNPFLSSEAAKVSRFYSTLTKINSGMLQLEALFESLFDLCRVENVVIVYRSLHILHVSLKYILTFERKSEERENLVVEHLPLGSSIDDTFGSEKKGHHNTGAQLLFSRINWIHLFELMRVVLVNNSEECVRLEVVSIMNVLLTRTDAYTEREKYGPIQVFGSISQLLKKEAGLLVQKEAVLTLYLLLNCPKLVVTFCSGLVPSAGAANNEENTSSFQEFTMILEGLADCIACCGNSLQALELHKSAIILLAFVASSGKSGFEILVNYKLSREATFLTLILQLLGSELVSEAAVGNESDEIFRARTLLIREVLILLNRHVSNPAHSSVVLRLLTNTRHMVSLTLDVANRLSRKEPKLGQSDSTTKQMRESEIVDLGRTFKRRVYTYLGELTGWCS
ncbi:hypothetical protein PTKIN_Ptkin04bG0235500 [Pterospermum kingtungense]